MSHKPGGPEDHDHEKHLQLGCDLDNDDRTPLDPEECDHVWEEACTVDEFKDGIEILREAGWPVSS